MKKLLAVFACVFLLYGTAHGGLVAHWSFNNEADIGADESGHGYELDTYGNPTWERGTLCFDGDGDYLEASISPSVLPQYTVCVRFKSSSALVKDSTHLISRISDAQYNNFFLRWAGAGRMSGGHQTAAGDVKVNTDAEPTSKLNNGKWHELWLTYNGTKLKIYRDGTLDASKTADPPGDSGNQALIRIGDLFKGCIDDVKICDEALTPPTISIVPSSTYVDYGFGGNMNHFYPQDFMRFNVDYLVEGGDPDGEYKVVAVALNRYPLARACPRKKKINKGSEIVGAGSHTLRYMNLVPVCAEPPAVEWADCVDVAWTLKLTTKLTSEDRQVVLDSDTWLMNDALFIHNSDQAYKGY